jgi:hypothetical protein
MPCRIACIALASLALIITSTTQGQLPDYPDESIVGIPVNYTEAKVGNYELPDPLQTESGEPVTTVEQWREVRRPELRALIERNQFGRAPGKPAGMHFEVTEPPTAALDGTALREQVRIHFGETESAPYVDVVIYVPANHEGPVPVLLSIGFMPNNLAIADPGVHIGRSWDRRNQQRVPAEGASRFGRKPVEKFIERGFGFATFNYADIEIDAKDAMAYGIRGALLGDGNQQLDDDQWGAIAGWAWGISRIVDYFETDELVDASRVAITGVSRLGKTVLWAGANDERIAAVIASCSGEGGAALSRRNYGETIGHLASPERYAYQFAGNYQKWAEDPGQAPYDAHEIIALVAPRPLLLQTGTSDKWSDPKGEFLAAKAATPVYELLGETGIDAADLPSANELVGGTLAFYMHDGGHGMVPSDWDVYLSFLDRRLKQ